MRLPPGGNKKPNQHYYPTRRPFKVASPLREKQRALPKVERYAPPPFFRQLRFPPRLDLPSARGALYRPAGLVWKNRVSCLRQEQRIRSFLYPQSLLRASIFPKGKLSLKGGGWV